MYLNVNSYKHLECDSDMINAAIRDSVKSGQIVVIPKNNERTGKDVWDITKTIKFHNDVTLILNNCHLRLGDGAVCPMFTNANCDLPLNKKNRQKNITVKGIGGALLDGGVHNGIYEKNGIVRKVPQKTDYKATQNTMMQFKNVENLVVEGIHIKDQRYWGIALSMVSYSRISNIRFSSDSNVPNQDGVDLLLGCHNVVVENISGCVGDNLIAICAITTTDSFIGLTDEREGDIRNITIRNVMGYGVGGCALIRLLNHDGYKLYNIRIDNVIETSPWSDKDAVVAQNPDLLIKTDNEGNIIPWKRVVPGEQGYRTEAAILIGESYWYNKSKAKPGDTFGISVSNVMTHSRFALWINNTLQDSFFDNIRVFGNGFMAVYFGEGKVENLKFSNISYDRDCKPLQGDEHIYIEWNNTKSDGLSCIYFNGTEVKDVYFNNVICNDALESLIGGNGTGEITLKSVMLGKKENIMAQNGIKVIIRDANV